MDKSELIHRRKKRCMAQVMEEFEDQIETRIPSDVAKRFKTMFRRKLNGLAVDCIEIMELGDMEINGHAQAIKDNLSPDSTVAAGGGSH